MPAPMSLSDAVMVGRVSPGGTHPSARAALMTGALCVTNAFVRVVRFPTVSRRLTLSVCGPSDSGCVSVRVKPDAVIVDCAVMFCPSSVTVTLDRFTPTRGRRSCPEA